MKNNTKRCWPTAENQGKNAETGLTIDWNQGKKAEIGQEIV